MSDNLRAFLDTIAFSEGTSTVVGSDRGYNVLVGGALFIGYADHPRKKIFLGSGLWSTAAGRYQILERYYDAYKTELGLADFSPDSQDAIALQMVREHHALDSLAQGLFDLAVHQCCTTWASFPESPYGQHTQKLERLRKVYVTAGGVIA